MSQALLGPSFDIHGGGSDLTFPHHENEVAQSCCANPDAGFANYWLHNEMLQVEGRKMSKSLGNFFTVRDLLDQGVPGEVIRFVFLGTHYRKTMDWTAEKAAQAEAALRKWRGFVEGIEPAPNPLGPVIDALSDDLNTAGALAALHVAAGQGDYTGLLASARLMGLLEDGMGDWVDAYHLGGLGGRLEVLWAAAKQSKDFSAVDAMKADLAAAGVLVQMGRDGVVLTPAAGFDAAKVEALK
jgi:cysteinyl-tRNA synthetase